MSDLERCALEQSECGEYLRGDGKDRAGAMRGTEDWIMEDVIIRREAKPYSLFLERKSQSGERAGFKPIWIPDFLFDFQQSLTEVAILNGRFAELADCGLGKTIMELVWAENVARHTNQRVLILVPLAVAPQTIREGQKFGVECHHSRDGHMPAGAKIIVTNYEQLHRFDANDFAGVVLDESSILKSFDGARRSEITEFMRTRPYRLLGTATAAPNDYIELGTSSEALGELGYLDMLNRFFKNDQHTIQPMRRHIIGKNFRDPEPMVEKWRFKHHAKIPFMRWVCSWARAGRKPSDFDPSFSDDRFILPTLTERQHLVKAETLAPGMLFSLPAIGLKEQREERRRTINERCEKMAELVDHKEPALIWCHLNDEGDLLEKIIPDCTQVSGKDSDEEKEEKFLAFTSGQLRVMATKEKIGAWGMNFQHCAHVLSFPSHSFEGYYQGLRRVHRFGQKRKVISDTVTTEGEQSVLENRQRKAKQADELFTALVEQMQNVLNIRRGSTFEQEEKIPSWL